MDRMEHFFYQRQLWNVKNYRKIPQQTGLSYIKKIETNQKNKWELQNCKSTVMIKFSEIIFEQ